jgi:hypothetical protein
MVANRNCLTPQLQECERITLVSVTIPRLPLDHGLHAEAHIQMAPYDFVGMKAQDQDGTPAGKALRIEEPLKSKGLLTLSGQTAGADINQLGATVRVKSWANQAVHTGKSHLHLAQDANSNLTKSWSIITAPTVIGAPNALGLMFGPTPSPPGPAPNGRAFVHPDGNTDVAGPGTANEFGDARPSAIDPLSRKPQAWLEDVNGELQPGRQSSPPQAGTEQTPSAQREHDDQKAEVETVMNEDFSPLRPPSPDSNSGLQGTRITTSSDLLDRSEATVGDTSSDPRQPPPEPKGRRPTLAFLQAIMKIRPLWRF